jgi:cystathionine gamma-lyase
MSPSLNITSPIVNGVVQGQVNGLKKHIDGFGTRAVHVGSDANEETGAVIPPISLSTTYKQSAIGVHKVKAKIVLLGYTFADVFLKGFEYSRSGNPNRNSLEMTLASLESGGAHALAFSSGSATTATVLQALGPNAHIISVNDVYGGTFRYIRRVAGENQGLEATFLDLENVGDEEILGAIRENTKVTLFFLGDFNEC